jgi:type IX secretion system PorP/SprF family membrane protein
MRKILLFFIVLFNFSSKLAAQQVATYAQYMFNGLAINPAYAGSQDALSASFLERFQNVGLKGAPQTETFSLHSPLVNKRVALGFLVVHDKIGVIDQTGMNLIYAYRIPISKNSVLSLGIQGGASFYKADYSSLLLLQNPDPVFSDNVRQVRPNIGAGVYYYSKLGYLGLSMPHMLNNVFNTGGVIVYQNIPIIFNGGYVFTLNRMLKMKPNFLLKILDGRTVEFDVNANVLFDEVLWVGVSYKSSKTVALLTEFQISDQFRFGYSYQITAGPIRTADLGSHELLVNYRFKYFKKGVVTPRYF